MSNIGKVKGKNENKQGIVNAFVSYRKNPLLNNYYRVYVHMTDYTVII